MKAFLALAIIGYIWAMAPPDPTWFRPAAAAVFWLVVLLVFLN